MLRDLLLWGCIITSSSVSGYIGGRAATIGQRVELESMDIGLQQHRGTLQSHDDQLRVLRTNFAIEENQNIKQHLYHVQCYAKNLNEIRCLQDQLKMQRTMDRTTLPTSPPSPSPDTLPPQKLPTKPIDD